MTYYFLENFEKYFLETLVQIESNSRKGLSHLIFQVCQVPGIETVFDETLSDGK